MRYSTILQSQMFYHKIPVRAKIPIAVFQCTFLGEFVFVATAPLRRNVRRVCLASHVKHPTSLRKRLVALGFRLIELVECQTFLGRVSHTRTSAYITIHRKPRNKISNAAIGHYFAELTRQLFDAGIARIQPRVFFLFQSTDILGRKRLATRDEVVISRVKLFRMFLPGRTTRSITAVLQEC